MTPVCGVRGPRDESSFPLGHTAQTVIRILVIHCVTDPGPIFLESFQDMRFKGCNPGPESHVTPGKRTPEIGGQVSHGGIRGIQIQGREKL